jgi:hypothetical protein
MPPVEMPPVEVPPVEVPPVEVPPVEVPPVEVPPVEVPPVPPVDPPVPPALVHSQSCQVPSAQRRAPLEPFSHPQGSIAPSAHSTSLLPPLPPDGSTPSQRHTSHTAASPTQP